MEPYIRSESRFTDGRTLDTSLKLTRPQYRRQLRLITNFTQLLNNKISLCLYLRITWPTAQISVTSFSIDQFHTAASVKKNRHFYVPRPFFCLPWGRPCGNHAKRCTDEKIIQCLPNPSQHVPIYIQQFPSYSNRKCKKSLFHVPQPTFLFPLETPLRLSCNMLHGWKYNSMLAKPIAACTYLSSIVSELYDA